MLPTNTDRAFSSLDLAAHFPSKRNIMLCKAFFVFSFSFPLSDAQEARNVVGKRSDNE
jgi:hypothetical protein